MYIEKRLQLNAQLGNCVLQDLELRVDVVHQVRYLRLRVQDLNALCIGVIAYAEWTRNRVGEFAVRREGLARLKDLNFITVLHGLLLGTLKAVGHIVEGLELGNGILGNARNLWLEVLQLGLIGETVFQLTVGREQAGTKSLQFTLLTAHSILHSEPEDLRDICL